MPTKVHLVKAMVCPIGMYGCESWTRKKAECWRIDTFELWCWRRLLRVSWTARRSNQSILKEINLDYSLEGLMLKLKLQYFGHPMQRADSFEKTLMLGKIEGGKSRRWQRMRWLVVITDSMDMKVKVKVAQLCLTLCDPKDHTVHGILQARILERVAFPFSKGIFPPQGLKPDLPHHRQILYQLSYERSPNGNEFE